MNNLRHIAIGKTKPWYSWLLVGALLYLLVVTAAHSHSDLQSHVENCSVCFQLNTGTGAAHVPQPYSLKLPVADTFDFAAPVSLFLHVVTPYLTRAPPSSLR